jgi:D-alanine-D-alanine ligase
VGATIVAERSEFEDAFARAFGHDSAVIVQEYIKGDEVTCAVLDDGKRQNAFALPPTQIIPKTSRFFDYSAKYTPGASEEVTPPRLPDELIALIQSAAVSAHQILGCSGMSRTDMIISGEALYVLETNTIPGMTETSLLPQAAAAAGIPFSALLDRLVRTALRKK